MKTHRNRIIVGAVILAVLAVAFWWGGNAPGLQGWDVGNLESTSYITVSPTADTPQATTAPTSTDVPKTTDTIQVTYTPQSISKEAQDNSPKIKTKEEPATIENKPISESDKPMTADEKVALAEKMAEGSSPGVEKGNAGYSEANGMELDTSTGKDKYLTDPVPEGKPVPVEPQNAVISDKELTCTLSVRCDTILENISWLDKEKVELVPKNGVIFEEKTVTFYEGESVFNLLLREMKKNKIHMEFENTPIYNSAYIEGIHNLYEFDCGELSGWMYKVNGWFPNYGCSRYQLNQNDKVEWVYTCDLGVDVGGYYATAGE